MTSEERLADLEARISALEGASAATAAGGSTPAAGGSAPAVADSATSNPEAVGESGMVGYQGDVRLHGQVSWTIRYSPTGALDLAPGPTAEVLAALGHPVRLALVRRLLHGPASAAELQEAAELSSTGQVYHHLKALTSARVVEQDGRAFRLPPTGVVPVLTMMLAAGDVAGLLR